MGYTRIASILLDLTLIKHEVAKTAALGVSPLSCYDLGLTILRLNNA